MATTSDQVLEFLYDHRAALMRAWTDAVRRRRGTGAHPILASSMQAILEHLAAGSVGDTKGLEAIVRSQTALGIERDVTPGTIVEELSLLDATISELWRREHEPGDEACLDRVRLAVHEVMAVLIDQRHALRTGVLESIERILGSDERDPSVVMERILSELTETADAVDVAAILVKEGDQLRVRAAVGLDGEVERSVRVPIGEGFAGRVAATGEPLLWRADSPQGPLVSDVLRASGVKVLYGVPLLHPRYGRPEVIGVVHMGSTRLASFSLEARRVFTYIAAHLTGLLYQSLLFEELTSERSRVRAFLDHAPAVLFLKDLEGRYLTMSRRVDEELGVAAEDFIGRIDTEVFPPEIFEPLRAHDRWVAEHRRELVVEETVDPGDGPRTFISVKFPVYDGRGRLYAIGSVSTNITERKRAEERQALLAKAGEIIGGSLDPEGTIASIARLFVPALADLCIVDLVEGGELRRLDVVYASDDDVEVANTLRNVDLDRSRPHLALPVLRERAPWLAEEWGPQHLDALAQGPEHRALLERLAPRSVLQVPMWSGGELLGVIVLVWSRSGRRYDAGDSEVVQELARRAALAIDNARLHDRVQRAVRSRDELLAIVAHDLRNPLRVVQLSQAVLRRACASEEQRQWVESGQRAVDRMARLIDDLVDAAIVEAGELGVQVEPVSAEELLLAAVTALGSLAEARGIELRVEPPVGDGLCVLGDRRRILQVFENLIGNAVKFSSAGTTITIGGRSDGDRVCFFVADEGPGIPSEEQERIFDRYGRARDQGRAGAGLGLSIARGIVEAHGGTLGVRSAPGRGTTFSFSLPKVPGDGD